MNKKIYGISLSVLAIATLTTNCVGIRFSTPENNPKREYSVNQSFSGISTTGTADIVYTEGNDVKITISAPEEAFDYITVKIENGTLKIGQDEKKKKNNKTVSSKYSITAYITAPAIRTLNTYGTGDIKAKHLSGDSIQLKTYGTGDIETDNIECKDFIAETYGTGDIEIGNLSAETAHSDTYGTGDIEIYKINVTDLAASTGGTGDITIHTGQILDARLSASGVGDIEARKVDISKHRISGKKNNIKL